MKLLSEEEALRLRAKLEKELKNAGEEQTIDLTVPELKVQLKEVYDRITNMLDYYMDLPQDTKNIVALWTIGTYFNEYFQAYPYLFINAMRGSGKTRLMKLIECFAHKGQLTTLLTEATMFRTTGTLLLDEFEGVVRKGNENLRELLNSAYKKGTKVFRMKKKKTIEGESQVVEEFMPYRPIAMANIYGMEEVLGDRCINVVLEKSNDPSKTKLMENFSNLEYVLDAKRILENLIKCSLCSVVLSRNVHIKWNEYVKAKGYTHTTLHTYTTLYYTNIHQKQIEINNIDEMLKGKDIYEQDLTELFTKIDTTGIEGRSLELFMPLFLIANLISDDILNNTLNYAKALVTNKKIDEIVESKDVVVYSLVARQIKGNWYDVSSLTSLLKLMVGDGESEWLNAKWVGRALKRLNLVVDKRRISSGFQVTLDVDKALVKWEMFKPKEETK